jgi:UDP-N-acetylglucosamine--N-acetylmuramyl-(pentapeptide) pyrophosphoryl-undecaprenol N-acetylglucosamine transferase
MPDPVAPDIAPPAKICLAASGGGHVRQLLDLMPVWRDHPHFFVTEPTALGKSIAGQHPTHFVSHVAWGQARLGAPAAMAWAGLANAWQSLRIVWRERPDIILTTGAGSMAFVLVWGRLLGARVALIDSFARFHRPSLFARLCGRFAHVRIAQSAASAENWPGSLVFDPFRRLDGPRPAKDALVFATVGATLPFPRLVNYVLAADRDGLLPGKLILQVGDGVALPEGVEAYHGLDFERVQAILERAELVICHAGTGSLITALKAGCHVIAIPRRVELSEHYDAHQSEIAEMFVARELVQSVDDEAQFRAALAALPNRKFAMATTEPAALVDFLERWISPPVGRDQ